MRIYLNSKIILKYKLWYKGDNIIIHTTYVSYLKEI